MKKEQLLPLLINHYEETIKEILNNKSGKTYTILNRTYTEFGICHCADNVFDVVIYEQEWVKKYLHDRFYWYEVPNNLFTREEVIESLEFRVDKMKEILSTL